MDEASGKELESLVRQIEQVPPDRLSELVKTARLNPQRDLVGINLADCNFRGDKLSRFNLGNANLIRADLSGADLSGANLSNANLSNANLSGAEVKNAKFTYAQGISSEDKQYLISRGAIFEDSPGDRSETFSKSPV